ncbi:MAG TPA: serine/threonine-protein kinase, partial [Myxococcota bacterium]|nr:serine/threonine-protein kinase [Myxococcota bacterium]
MNPGDQTGPYTLERSLGEGGAATVWLARDAKHGHVAMKFFPALRSSAEEFRKEAAAMRQRHPNLVALLDAGLAGDGSPYLAMEYVPGEDLRTILEQQGSIPHQALPVALQVFRALDAIHRNGMVHGDIKPENVRLQESLAKVVDFGRARLRHLFGTSPIFPGTPPYMLPSLFRGGAPTPRSDCFAAWVMTYELVGGVRPFTQGGLRQADDSALPRYAPLADADLDFLVRAGLEGRLPDARSAELAIERFLTGNLLLPLAPPPAPRVEVRYLQDLSSQLEEGKSTALVGDPEVGRAVLESLDRLWGMGGGRTLWARADWIPPGQPLAGALSLAVQVSDSLRQHELEEVAGALGPLSGVLSAYVPATRAWLSGSSLPDTRPTSERVKLALRRMVAACPRPLLVLVDGLDRLDGASRRFFTALVAEGELTLVGTSLPGQPHGMPYLSALPAVEHTIHSDRTMLSAAAWDLHRRAVVLGLNFGELLARATGQTLEQVRLAGMAGESAGLARYSGVESIPRPLGEPVPTALAAEWCREAARRLDAEKEPVLVARYARLGGDKERLGQVLDRAVEDALRLDPALALELLAEDPLPPTPARVLRHFRVALLGRERATAEGLLQRLRELPGVRPVELAEAESDLLFQDGNIPTALAATRKAAVELGYQPVMGLRARLGDLWALARVWMGRPVADAADPARARVLERLHDLHFLSDNVSMLQLHSLWRSAAPRDYRARAMGVIWESALGRHDAARKLEEDLLAEGEEERNPVASAVVILHRGIARLWRGETVSGFSDGVDACDRLVRVGDPYLAALAGSLVWTAGLHIGAVETMRRVASSLKTLANQTGDTRGQAWTEGGEGVIAWMEGDYDTAVARTRAWAESAASRGENSETLARKLLGDILLDQGKLEEAVPELLKTTELIQRFHLQMD